SHMRISIEATIEKDPNGVGDAYRGTIDLAIDGRKTTQLTYSVVNPVDESIVLKVRAGDKGLLDLSGCSDEKIAALSARDRSLISILIDPLVGAYEAFKSQYDASLQSRLTKSLAELGDTLTQSVRVKRTVTVHDL